MCILHSPSFIHPPPFLSTRPLSFSLSHISIHLSLSTPLTSVGVPDAPRIMLDGDTLTWEAPNDRGSPITGYRITAMCVPLYNLIIFLASFQAFTPSNFCLQYAKTERGGLARFCHVNVHLDKQMGRVPTKRTCILLSCLLCNIQSLHTWTDTT